MRHFLNLLAACVLALATLTAHAAEKRVALVVGNSAYPTSRLDNPKNDATVMAATFRRLGFEVDLLIDAGRADFDSALKRYAAKADKADAAVLFYAGHGMQANGHNYLVPIDANPQSERDLKREMIKLDDIIDDMGNARVKLVFFDACRDNPLARSFSRGGARGMAAPAEATGTLISFATKHGNTAADGEGKHSPYTEALLAALEKPTEEVHALLRRKVQEAVKKKTRGQQEPWSYGNLNGDFYFIFTGNTTVNVQAPDTAPRLKTDTEIEQELWDSIKHADSADALNEYLKAYPKGRYLAQARILLAKLKKDGKEAKPQLPTPAAHDPVQVELSFWDSIKSSSDKADFEEYLQQWPAGRFAGIARNRVKAFDSENERRAHAQREEVEASRQAEEASRREAELRPGRMFRDCPDCPEMVVIPAGSFTMGSPVDEKGRGGDEGPQHEVNVKAFALGKTEVTLGEFRRFVRATGYKTEAERDVGGQGCRAWDKSDGKWEWRAGRYWDNPGFKQSDKQPVACVSWNDAKEYVKWLSNTTGKLYRLPSEAEWEYAARAGSATARYWGNNPNDACRYANVADQTTHEGQSWTTKHECKDGYWFTAPVASYTANAFGLHDMIGNVWEWVEDCSHDSYSGAPTDGSAWSGDCSVRGLRGGSWFNYRDRARSADRVRFVASERVSLAGFRPARMLP